MTNGFMIFFNAWTALILGWVLFMAIIYQILIAFFDKDGLRLEKALQKAETEDGKKVGDFLLFLLIFIYLLGLAVARCIFNLIELIGG